MEAAVNSAPFEIGRWSQQQLDRVEQALDRWVSAAPSGGHQAPLDLVAAMRYAVLDGGKRLRPLLVLAAAEATQNLRLTPLATDTHDNDEAALRAACAVELIHAYSLVHDDLPCMDNDVLRRGKPTVHVKFGEARALLAGDALQALAFELLTPDTGVRPQLQAWLCRLLSRAAGSVGMAGGQAIDLASVGLALSERELRQMHKLKTGALLQASVMMGAACGHSDDRASAGLAAYGAAIGLAFQVVDDILDVTADSKTLGKTPGKDAAQGKPTFVSLLGLEQAAACAQRLRTQALASLQASALPQTQALQGLADALVNRVC